ncbi:hypothetical protein [Halomarina litorea]|uniref:hypothetical protein n=1 Tax=Halomarina litorea TaxID=2961595 RepID=UPI0020C4C86F|nr:hypothetical protein [Halomarina sp. BCD28]
MSSTRLRRRSPDSDGRPKATLFCPTCGHESLAGDEGDWEVSPRRESDRRALAYECPVCGTTLTVQPVFE